MEFIGHDVSRIVYLTNIVRAEGSTYLPELAQLVIQRYSFLKFPNADDLQKDTQAFAVGKFDGVQINELNVYGDGIIVSGRCSTQRLEAFIKDLFDVVRAVGYSESDIFEPEMYFESSIVVRARTDLAISFGPPPRTTSLIQDALAKQTGANYLPFSTHFETDLHGPKTRRRPVRFTLERRTGTPFDKHVFYSQAPIRTEEHLALLEQIETLGG
ncbi:hypothetical protein [Bradyrhizobium sp. BWC-3-1]|uniref:hypothetical protein n=1 Tax=Bradyrhizobium sp. BWC-3-1 TaxID=3080012 RepID=UPI00293EC31F|nr:hypothetical protein [Bradyrhizobium sp. BWC-3-1]WOH55298.1 hypothetical protein RX329_23590 [Bradyrhizobium sp. BWC-3-1]